jgi:hypothetical protein
MMQFLLQLLQIREAALLGLREDKAAIHCHLEATAAAGDQGQALDVVAIAVKKLLRRPGGSKEVVSRHAVLDLNGQFLGHFSPPFDSSITLKGLLRYMLALTASSFNRRVRPLRQFRPATWFDDMAAGPGMITMCLSVQCQASAGWTHA